MASLEPKAAGRSGTSRAVQLLLVLGLLAAPLPAPSPAGAQWTGISVPTSPLPLRTSPGELEDATEPARPGLGGGLWQLGGNPAALGIRSNLDVSPPNGGTSGGARTAITRVSGDRRLVQEASERTLVSAMMYGGQENSTLHSTGIFRYRRVADREVRWSATAFPHAGTPYVWTDSTGGDWERDLVEVHGAGGTAPGVLPSDLLVGASISARFGQGARRNDPRPLFRIRDLRFSPGVALSGERWTVGLAPILAWHREEGEIGYFAGDDPFVFRIRGYGTFDRTQLVRGVRTREGRTMGAGVQLRRESDREQLVVAGQLTAGSDSIRQGIARPEFAGGHDRVEGRMAILLTRQGQDAALRTIRAMGRHEQGRGTDPVFRALNTRDLRTSVSVEAGTRHPSEGGRAPGSAALLDWTLELGVSRDEREDIAADTRWSVTSARAGVRVGADVPLPALGVVRLTLAPAVTRRLADDWHAGRPTRMTEELVRPDYLVFRQGSRDLAAGVVWHRVRPSGGVLQLDLEVSTSRGQGAVAASSPLPVDPASHRTALQLSVSLLQ